MRLEVSVINPNETGTAWRSHPREAAVQLYLSSVEAVEADLVNARAAGLPVSLNVVPVSDWIDPDDEESGTDEEAAFQRDDVERLLDAR